MKKEHYALTVIHRAADMVMQERLKPTPDGHSLSFVGREIKGRKTAGDVALSQLHKELGFKALSLGHLGKPKIVSYHNKVGHFFDIKIPGDTEIRAIRQSKGMEYMVLNFADVLDALRDQTLLELSGLYVERNFQ